MFLCLVSNNTCNYFWIIYNLRSWLAQEHGKTQELPRNDEVLTTVPGYIFAISCSSFIRCFMLLFPLVASSQSSKQRWGERSRIQFPHYSALSNFFVDNYAKIRAKRGLDQWKGSLPVCWWKLPNKPREEGYVLVGLLLSWLNSPKDSISDFKTTILYLNKRAWHNHSNHWPSLGE